MMSSFLACFGFASACRGIAASIFCFLVGGNPIGRRDRQHPRDRVDAISLRHADGLVVVLGGARSDRKEQRLVGRARRAAVAALVRPLGRLGRLLLAQLEQQRRRLGGVAQICAERRRALLVHAARVFDGHLDAGEDLRGCFVRISSISSAFANSSSLRREASSAGIASRRYAGTRRPRSVSLALTFASSSAPSL